MTVEQLAKVDARESGSGYEDGEQLPPPPESITIPHNGYADAEQAAYYASSLLTNEQTPASVQVDGPRSCERYWQSCECVKCEARDRWYETAAT